MARGAGRSGATTSHRIALVEEEASGILDVMTKRPGQRGERRIRLKPQYSDLYRGIPSNEWWPAWLMAEKLLELAETQGVSPRDRICDPAHFEFRGGQSRGPRLEDLRTRRSDVLP